VWRVLCASSSPDLPLSHLSVCILKATTASSLSQDFKLALSLGMPTTTARYTRAALALRDLHHPYFPGLSNPPISRPTELSATLKP
jgi:hypothetical protein